MNIPAEKLKEHIRLGVRWITDAATIKDNTPCGEKGCSFNYAHWQGALRGEYENATGTWDVFCPYWHTGQAVKALVCAAEVLEEPSLLENAKFCANFLLANQLTDGEDAGLFPAFEDRCDLVNTSAILESIDGMFKLSEATGDTIYQDAALKAVDWVARKAWQDNLGKFFDYYQITGKTFVFGLWGAQNRPLLDDAIFVKAWKLTGNTRYFDIAKATAETLIKEEYPSGNWIKICPCNPQTGIIHPRHAYWWGRPMLTMYKETNDQRFLGVFCRSVEWYDKALRRDGGIIRDTGADFKTASFGHATSGSACAALCFMDRAELGEHDYWMSRAECAIKYCMAMQFTNAQNPALQGAVLEKICFPDGTDRSPYYLRDLGTIFFIQAAAEYLKRCF